MILLLPAFAPVLRLRCDIDCTLDVQACDACWILLIFVLASLYTLQWHKLSFWLQVLIALRFPPARTNTVWVDDILAVMPMRSRSQAG